MRLPSLVLILLASCSGDVLGELSDAGPLADASSGPADGSVGPPRDGGCVPKTCAQANAQCGAASDGCGGTLPCGSCTAPQTCAANRCVAATDHQETKTLPGATGKEAGGLIPVCCSPNAEEKADIQAVFDLLNAHRKANGLAALTYDDKLEAAILGHCHHMASHAFFDHDAPEAAVSSPWDRAPLCGTTANAENIAWGQATPDAVMSSWKKSAGHNANMLGGYTRVGVGRYRGADGIYWGQMFKQ